MKNNKMTREEKRRLLLNKKYEKNAQANEGNFARPDGTSRFLKVGKEGAAAATPISKRMLAIILAIVFVLTVVPTTVFIGLKGRASNEAINNLGPVEMFLRVNGVEQEEKVQMQPGPIADHIDSITIENAPAKLEFEGAFMVDRGKTPVTETRIASVGSYQGDDYYSLNEENDTGIKRENRQELVLVYSSEYDVTTNPGEGTIEVDNSVPYGTALNVSVTPPKGYSINTVTYVIGEANYTASPNNNGDFTIPANQVVNDIEITATYSQIATFTVKDARKVQNSKYYNLYGLEGHGGVTATIGVSAEGQPYDKKVGGGHDLYNDWTEDKYQLFTPDAVLCSDKWGGTYTRYGTAHQVYGAPNTSVYAGYENITTNSNGTIKDIQPNNVSNGDSTTFYVYSQSKSGNSNGWGLNMLSINGVDINYPAGSTVGSSEETDLDEDSHVTVTLISTDSPLYWNNGDVSYSYTTNTKYFAKTNKTTYSSSEVEDLWYYRAPSVNKHRYIYQVDIDHVQENLEVAYNFKDVAKRQILITGLEGIDETGAAYEWRNDNVTSTGLTNDLLPRLFESRDYYYTSAATPATNNADDLGYWRQNIYDAFFFEEYGSLGVNFVPSANVYTYRIKSGYNPYTVEARARYGGTGDWISGDDLLAGPTEDVIGDLDKVILAASESTNAEAVAVLDRANLPDSWKEEGTITVNWAKEYLDFNSNYHFWGTSENLKHGTVGTRSLRTPVYGSDTHNTPNGTNTENKLFLNKVSSYENTLQTQNIKNYKFYGLALQQNESKDQLLQLNAHPYQYTMVFDANGGVFPDDLEPGYVKLAENEFGDTDYYTEKTAESIKFNRKYTLEDGATTSYMPKRSMQPERKGYFFAGWRLYQNGEPVDVDGYDNVYGSKEAFVIDENSIDFSEGNVKADANHTFTFKAEWVAVAPESDMVNVSVSIYKQNGAGENDYATIVDHAVERQVAGETVLLNQHKPDPEEYYVLNETKSTIKTTTNKNSDVTSPDNQLSAYFDYRTVDLDVTKRVTGNPKTLRDGFDITIKLTRDQNSPESLTVEQALDLIAITNAEGIPVTTSSTENTITYVGTFGRSNHLVFDNVPYGWTAEVSEAKAPVENDKTDYETTITTDPEYGEVDDTAVDKTTWTGRLTKDTNLAVTNSSDSYLVLDKTLSRGDNGTYKLTLDAFATGDVGTEVKTEKVPTDFVVIVDQSGSMAIDDMATDYTSVSTVSLDEAAEGNYYYYDSNTKEHYRVYGKKGYMYEYFAPNTKWTYDIVQDSSAGLRWFQNQQEAEFAVENQYYHRDSTSPTVVYRPVKVSIAGAFLKYNVMLSYLDKNGQEVWFTYPDKPAYKPWATFDWGILGEIGDPYVDGHRFYGLANSLAKGIFNNDNKKFTYAEVDLGLVKGNTGMYINWPLYKRHVGYTGLYYRDINGKEHVLTPSTTSKTSAEYCDSQGHAWTTNTGNTPFKYSDLKKADGTVKRLDALDVALNEFAQAVADETDEVHGSVDNKIAIVGFSSKNQGTSNTYNNTEVLTGSTIDSSQEKTKSHRATDNPVDPYRGYYYFPYHGEDYTPSVVPDGTGTNYNGPQYYTYANPNAGYTTHVDDLVYKNALVNSTNGTAGVVNDNITDAIKSISAHGGTKPADGFEMAYQILNNRTEKTYKLSDGTVVPRNAFVIYFTDGRPGNYSYSDQYEEANAVVKSAKKVKDLGASVFSIGVFDESDGNPLTYSKVTDDNKNVISRSDGYLEENSDKEFDQNWVETYHPDNGGYYYLNREWTESDTDNFGEVANDTISDYMSVVSSNFPDATGFTSDAWIAGNETRSWLEMTTGENSVRGNQIAEIPEEAEDPETAEAVTVNKYYRMASNQKTLIAAFKSAISSHEQQSSHSTTGMDGTTALLRDVINADDFEIPETPNFDVKVYTQIGTQRQAPGQGDSTSDFIDFVNDDNPTEENAWVDVTNQVTISDWAKDEDGNAYVDVSGFDYGKTYIANGKAAIEPESNKVNEGMDTSQGKKLIVVISGLVPKRNATGTLKSNTDDSGIYKLVAEDGSEEMRALQMDAFISPTMERYKYNFTEPSVITTDEFNITLKRTGTESVLALYDDDGDRTVGWFDENGNYTWEDAKNGDSIYWELLEAEENNQLEVSNLPLNVSAQQQKEYTYSLDLIDSDGTTSKDFGAQADNSFILKKETTRTPTIQVTNVSNWRDVTITEETKGVAGQADFSDRTKQFPIHMSITGADDEPYAGNITATITRKTGETESPVTLHFGNDGELNNPNDVKLADGDKIDFRVLDGYTLKVWETESDADNYTVTYNPDEDEEVEGTEITIGDTNAVKVINTLTENPVITGFHGIDSKLNPFLTAAGVVALAGGAWLALTQYKRKKEAELAAYQAGKSE